MKLKTFASMAERDIDLLLVEEICANADFGRWFFDQVGETVADGALQTECWHSVTDGAHGESDLIARLNGDVAALIENKIDALAQPDQAERYRRRGSRGVAAGNWRRFVTCIVAPEAYLKSNQEARLYDTSISYEAVRAWFLATGSHRARHKALVLTEAIEQNRRGYSPDPDENVTAMWAEYWATAQDEHLELEMPRPGPKPAKSDWPTFRPTGMPAQLQIIHKWNQGCVDLQISGAAGAVDELARRMTRENVEVVATGKSAVVRIRVPPIDRFVPADAQLDQVRDGLEAASTLFNLSKRVSLEI